MSMINNLKNQLVMFFAVITLSFPLFTVNAGELPGEINLTSEAWEEATNQDGSGLYWDIMRLVYEPLGIKVKYSTMSYARSVSLVKQEKADAWLGAYIDEVEGVLYPQWHFDADLVSALYKKDDAINWQGEQSLAGKNVGWIKGYDYNEYMETKFNNKEYKSRKQAIKLLEKGRLDFFLDAKEELDEEVEKGYFNAADFEIKPIMDLKLYLAFANNERGQQLKEVFDQRFPDLLKSGEVQKLYNKWDWESFPFKAQ
ncbi:ABC transporter substrate-binding protein [uncultured Photobacterium sp.]|uniref:substrate-binding periplasmic protein n=1 Tax=uncultured Photobacterium sp. TaxID=173973 RepID=UPI00261911BF|nr:transporter substrate-binding domain-containing protein [uncultured Photobacterium sp.]